MSLRASTRAATLIGDARSRANVSQAELARRTGMPAPVLSAYEHGRRQPSVAALERIAEAVGLEIRLLATDDGDLVRAGEILEQVLDLAELLPSRRRGDLAYPPLVEIAA
ncbi:MAG TPA: helix-turn-helix transcriptional regulator [Solirubrobacteraceae bacterium]|jgi:transcriptional regulator with XRE-family HTH domain|nr:helix-turn-helix transcriptional regulator [Solirubrobacteraceae bacterium]